DQRAARRLAHVVGVGLEREAPERDAPPGERRAEARANLVAEHALLRVVGPLDCREHAEWPADFGRRALQRADVLREARAAEPGARVQEVIADARIRADAAAHF